MRLIVLSILILTLAVGCGEDNPTATAKSSDIVLTTDSRVYRVGDTVTVSVINLLADTVFIPACCGDLEILSERQINGHWSDFTFPAPCIAICSFGISLEPGLSQGEPDVRVTVEPGLYRYKVWRTTRSNEGLHPEFVYSRPFRVE